MSCDETSPHSACQGSPPGYSLLGDLVGAPHVAIVGLHPLAWLKTVQENTVKNLDVGHTPAGCSPLT
jgi:hypothetical protein